MKRYFHGRGVRKNCKKAIECYEKAAEFGDPSIQYEVAYIFEYENEIKDYKKAIELEETNLEFYLNLYTAYQLEGEEEKGEPYLAKAKKQASEKEKKSYKD